MKTFWILAFTLLIGGCAKCLTGHSEMRHEDAGVVWIPMWVGKTMTLHPIFHGERDYAVYVCDEYEKKK